MSDINPYQSPESPIVPETSQNTGAFITENMLRYLNEASPWLRFLGILGYITCGFTVAGGIFSGAAFSAMLGDFAGLTWLVMVVYIALGAIMFFPAHFIFCFGLKIRNYRFTNAIEDLEAAFKNNRSIWKFFGILSIIYLAIIPVFIIVLVIIGVASVLNVF